MILQDPPKKRFKPTISKDMDELFEARQAPNTKRNTLWGLKIFQGTYIYTYHLWHTQYSEHIFSS